MKESIKYRQSKVSSMIRRISIVLMVMTVFLITVSGYKLAFASSSNISSNNYTFQSVVVQKGDTLWGLAANADVNADINLLVHKTIQYNNLASTYIQPGQVIYVPTRL